MVIQLKANIAATVQDSIQAQFSWADSSCGENVIIFGVDNSSSVITDSKNKNISVLVEVLSEAKDNDATTVEAKYYINFDKSRKRFMLSLHYNERNGFSFVSSVKIYQFKAKKLELKPYP